MGPRRQRTIARTSRAALEAMLATMLASSPGLGFAYRNLTEVTDDDLRTMIQDAQWMDDGDGSS